MKNNYELVEIKNDQIITTSRTVAEVFGKRHKNVMQAIENLECSQKFTELNFQPSKYKDESGKNNKQYLITRDGFTFLAMGFTGKKAAEFKETYIEAFNKMEKLLSEKHSQNWMETRRQGKLTRKAETDIIKELVKYAETQGSKNSNMLYTVYSKLANSTLGIKGRDKASTVQLNNLSLIEHIILNTITNGIAEEKHYKEIYQDCKNRLTAFVELTYLNSMIELRD